MTRRIIDTARLAELAKTHTVPEIAAEMGFVKSAIENALKRTNTGPAVNAKKKAREMAVAAIRPLWLSGKTIQEISDATGYSIWHIYRVGKDEGLPTPRDGAGRDTAEFRAAIKSLWSRPNMTLQEIADRLNATKSAVSWQARQMGLRPRVFTVVDTLVETKGDVVAKMWADCVSAFGIGTFLGVSVRTVYRMVRQMKLPPRTQTNLITLAQYQAKNKPKIRLTANPARASRITSVAAR